MQQYYNNYSKVIHYNLHWIERSHFALVCICRHLLAHKPFTADKVPSHPLQLQCDVWQTEMKESKRLQIRPRYKCSWNIVNDRKTVILT